MCIHRSAKFQTTQTLQHSASSKTPGSVQPKVPPPKIKRKPLASQLSADTVSYVKKESSNFHPPPPPGPPPAEDSTSPESNHPKITVNRPPLRPPILPSSTKPMPSQPGKARHVTKAYSSKAVAQKPYVNPSRSHSQSVTGSEPHHYKNIDSTGRCVPFNSSISNTYVACVVFVCTYMYACSMCIGVVIVKRN